MKGKKKRVHGVVRVRGKSRGVIWSRKSTLSVIFSGLATASLVMALTAVGIPVVPAIWYRLKPGTSEALASVLRRPVTTFEEVLIEEGVKEEEPWQPPLDANLPMENRLIVESLGIDTPLVESAYEDYEEAFRKGVWRIPDFGTPPDRELPMILAAHRFGYLSWTNTYRFKNSFYKLPDLEEGDLVTVIWGQRKYTYEIYDGGEGEEISNYTADLILYTCKFLESDVRFFRYGRLIER